MLDRVQGESVPLQPRRHGVLENTEYTATKAKSGIAVHARINATGAVVNAAGQVIGTTPYEQQETSAPRNFEPFDVNVGDTLSWSRTDQDGAFVTMKVNGNEYVVLNSQLDGIEVELPD